MSVTRLKALQAAMKADQLDAVIVMHADHVRYLSGFTGSSGLLAISADGIDFLTDSRYTLQAKAQVKGARVTTVASGLIAALKELPRFQSKHLRVGFNPDYTAVTARDQLQKALPHALLVPAGQLFAQLGWIKDSSEIASITAAVKISDLAFKRILQVIRPGVREREVAAELEYQMSMLGSEKPAFESIVASGYRSALPHGLASDKKIAKGDFVTLDFGATVNGYVSDITRTVVVGRATERQKKIYDYVLKAHLAAIRKIKAGVACKAVDEAARSVIAKSGHGKTFGHGTGHGIGFYIHVGPRLSSLSTDILQVNNVVTVEPGIYIEGWGGVRIEDDVVVTKTGGRPLNTAEKKLLELPA